VTSALAAVLLLITSIGFPVSSVTPADWLVVVIISITTGSGAILLYYWGLRRIRAMTATICELCLPLSAVFFDYVVNGSRLSAFQIVGALLMIAAITQVSTRQGRAEAS
jgi:drug/metabolite transporter (DMT)-like permease